MQYKRSVQSVFLIFILFLFSGTLFAQDEPVPDRIWQVEMEGNERYSDIEIKRYISNERPSFWKRLVRNRKAGNEVSTIEIRKDVIRIERFYQRRGFPEVEIDYELREGNRSWRKKLVFLIEENEPIRIDTVLFSLDASQKNKELIEESSAYQRAKRRIPFRNGGIFKLIDEPEVIGQFTRGLKNLGFVYATTNVVAEVDSVTKGATIFVENKAGPRAVIDEITIEGANTLDRRFILRETGLNKGDVYSNDDIREAQREVYKHQLFRLALISIPDQVQDTSLQLQLRVKELPLRSVRLRGGIGYFDRLNEPVSFSNSYKLLRTQASWTYRNMRGKGEQFSTTTKFSYYEKFFSAEYLFPYVYNTKSSFSIRPFIENRIEDAYSITSGGLVNAFGYEYSQNLTGTFSYEFAVNNEYDIANTLTGNSEELLPDSVLAYNVSSFSFNLYYAKGLKQGERGFIIQPFLELSGLFGESTFSFQKLSLDVRKYTPLTESTTLATRARAGAIYFSKQDSLPADVEFYTGGTNTIRGWSRGDVGPKRAVITSDSSQANNQSVRYVPTGGKAFLNINVEVRQTLNSLIKGLGVAAFLDGGQVWQGLNQLDERPIQFGAGGGLRYRSPIGPIRVDLAYKLNPTDEDLRIYEGIEYGGGLSRWRIHFSIGQAF